MKDDCSYNRTVKHLEWTTTQFTEGSLNGGPRQLQWGPVCYLFVCRWRLAALWKYRFISEVTEKTDASHLADIRTNRKGGRIRRRIRPERLPDELAQVHVCVSARLCMCVHAVVCVCLCAFYAPAEPWQSVDTEAKLNGEGRLKAVLGPAASVFNHRSAPPSASLPPPPHPHSYPTLTPHPPAC